MSIISSIPDKYHNAEVVALLQNSQRRTEEKEKKELLHERIPFAQEIKYEGAAGKSLVVPQLNSHQRQKTDLPSPRVLDLPSTERKTSTRISNSVSRPVCTFCSVMKRFLHST